MKICSMIYCNIKIERFYLGFMPYLFPTKLELNKEGLAEQYIDRRAWSLEDSLVVTIKHKRV